MGKFGIIGVSLLALSTAFSSGANAQANAQGATGEDEEAIIVTAQRRQEALVDVPINLQVVTADVLTQTGIENGRDLVRLVPGLSATGPGGRQNTRLVLRGLRTGNDSGKPTTTSYIDEVQIDLPFRSTPLDIRLLDVERVEVLRGPQGTLYGGGAIGGTIRYISKKPDSSNFEGEVLGSLSGTRNGGTNYEIGGKLNVPLATDKLALRANIGYANTDGFIENAFSGEKNINFEKTINSRIALRATPTENFTATLTHYYQQGRYGSGSIIIEGFGPRRTSKELPERQRDSAHLANLTLDYDFGFATLTSTTSYVRERLRSTSDATPFVRDALYAGLVPDPTVDLPRFTALSSSRQKARTWTQEVRLVSPDDQKLSWIVGAYYNQTKGRDRNQETVPLGFDGQEDFETFLGFPLLDGNEFLYALSIKERQIAAFGELKYQFTDAFQATLGGRVFNFKSSGSSFAIDQWLPDGRDPATGLARFDPIDDEVSSGRTKDTDTVFKLNLSYDFDDALVYATVAQGYRDGGFNSVGSNTGVPTSQLRFKPDSIVSYEVGGRTQFLGNKGYLSASAFYIDWKDIQTTTFTDLGFGFQGNAGKARSLGFEFESGLRDAFIDGLDLGLNYSYTDAKLRQTVTGLGFKGERIPLVPRHSGSIRVNFERNIGNSDTTWGFDALVSYSSSSFTRFGPFVNQPFDDDGDDSTPVILVQEAVPAFLRVKPVTVADFSINFAGKRWSASLFLENAFDSKRLGRRILTDTSLSPFTNGNVIDTDIGRPRTVGIDIGYKF
jgi:iron complex outermembrane recepter protein